MDGEFLSKDQANADEEDWDAEIFGKSIAFKTQSFTNDGPQVTDHDYMKIPSSSAGDEVLNAELSIEWLSELISRHQNLYEELSELQDYQKV